MVYGIDDVPPIVESITLGFQHYLTMFGAAVAVPLLLAEKLGIENKVELGILIGTMFFVSGIATFLQTTWGNRLPIVQGGTFSFLAPAFTIAGMASLADAGWQIRMQHIQGAVIIGSLFEIVMGYAGFVGWLLRFIGPVTIAPTIALIGIALFKIGAPIAGTHWGIGGLTILLIIVFSQYLKSGHRIFRLFPILLAIVVAWAVATILSITGVFPQGHPAHVTGTNVVAAPWFRVPYPFQWGMPVFGAAAIVGMLAGYIASIVESIGDYYACARLAGAPIPDRATINRGIGMEGIGCLIAGIFGTGNGTTSSSENIGAIGITGVGSRRVVQMGALLMIGFAVIGKFGALFTTIPQPIVGGMYCAMFGMIASVGLSNLQFIDLNSSRNLFVLGFAFYMGLSIPEYFSQNPISFDPAWIGEHATFTQVIRANLANVLNTLGSTGMAVGAFFALVLDNTIPGTDEERGMVAWKRAA